MADYQIDELSLKIDIEGANKQKAQNIKDIASAIRSLNKAVSNSGALNNLKEYSKSLQKISNSIVSGIQKSRETAAGTVKKKKQDIETKNATSRRPMGEKKDGSSARRNIAKELDKVNDKTKESGKAAEKSASGWNKFTKSLGRIAMYRAIRRALQIIVQSAQQGLENIRKVDKELDKSMKTLSLAGTSLKNSFASMLAPIIKSITPLITRLADGIATIINRIEEAKAALKGSDTYTKILTSDTEEWKKQLEKVQGTLLSFDKFESLNKEKQYTGVIQSAVGMSQGEAESIVNKMESLKVTIIAIAGALALWKITGFLSDLGKVASILGVGTKVLGILGVVIGISEAISGIKDMIHWDDFTSGAQKVANVLQYVFGLVAAIAGVLAIIKSGTVVGGIAAALAVVATIGAVVAGVGAQSEKLKRRSFSGGGGGGAAFAEGGIPETGTMFLAGESGAEIVATSRSGKTGVSNVEQISQAFLQALINYNAAQNGQTGGGNVYIDSRKVGQVVENSVYNEGVRVGHFKRV